jgi:hypothetical protein
MTNQEILATRGCNVFMSKEKNRYKRKGYGLIFACLIALGFFWGVPAFGRNYWASIL